MNANTLSALVIAMSLASTGTARAQIEEPGKSPRALPATRFDAIDACSLLTEAEINAAVGVPMLSGRHEDPATLQECNWRRPIRGLRGPDAPPMTILWLQLFVEPANGCEFDRSKTAPPNITSLSGLGEDAYYTEQAGSMMTLHVREGDICVLVTWQVIADRQAVMDAEKSIAAQVLSRL
jgi:hypothetical protein